MPPSFASATGVAANTEDISWNHTIEPTASAVLVACASKSAAPSGATVGGVAATLVGDLEQSGQSMVLYRLLSPPAGVQTVALNYASTVNKAGISITFLDSSRLGGFFASGYAEQAGGSNNPSLGLVSRIGSIGVGIVSAFTDNPEDITPGGSWTQREERGTSGVGGEARILVATIAGALSLTFAPSWSTSSTYIQMVLSIDPEIVLGMPTIF